MDDLTFKQRFGDDDLLTKTMKQLEKIGIEKDTHLYNDLFYFAENKYFGLKTPHLAMETKKSLPISCFLTAVGEDDVFSIIDTLSEAMKLSVAGGGVSIDLDVISPKGTVVRNGMATTPGIKNFIEPCPSMVNSFKQFLTKDNFNDRSTTWCFYISASHPDALEIIELFDKHNENSNFLHPSIRLCVKMTREEFILYCTMYNNVLYSINYTQKDTIIFNAISKTMELRYKSGNINILFVDNMMLKRKTNEPYECKNSNICTEIALPANAVISSVCALININTLELYKLHKLSIITGDKSHIRRFIKTIMYLGKYMLNYTLKKLKEHYVKDLPKIIKGIEEYQSIGMCLSGINDILLYESIAIEDIGSSKVTDEFLINIIEIGTQFNYTFYDNYKDTIHADSHLHKNKTYFSRLWTIPPNSNSRQSIPITCLGPNPLYSNYYAQHSANHSVDVKNKFLEEHLEKYESKNLIWKGIKNKLGSVQHLPSGILSDDLKKVFKTAFEVDQSEHLRLCALRNVYLDHCQSIDLYIDKDKISFSDFIGLHKLALYLKLPTLYYCYFKSAVKQIELAPEVDKDCDSCTF